MKEIRKKILQDIDRSSLFRKIIDGLVIGILVGLLISIYRILVVKLQGHMRELYSLARSSTLYGIILLLFLAGLGLIVGILTQKEPKIGGSGIPQVSGQVHDLMEVNWKKVLPFKFIGGLIGLASGLTVGREGPSVQMGASLGQGYGDLRKAPKESKKLLITAGAAAGLSAAFNAPLSGLCFVLEELHQKFDKGIFLIALVASLLADLVSALFFGYKPVIDLGSLKVLDFNKYIYLVVLGGIIGILSQYFIKGIYYMKLGYRRIRIPTFIKVMLAFLITGIAIILVPDLFGSGEGFIFLPIQENRATGHLLFLLVCKFLLLLIAFCSGMPGGIFLPMLVLGSIIGNIYGLILVSLGLIPSELVVVFSTLAMGANFAAIVRSPITSIFLLLELTGSFTYFLPVGIVVLCSYMTIEYIGVKPVYEILLEMQLKKY